LKAKTAAPGPWLEQLGAGQRGGADALLSPPRQFWVKGTTMSREEIAAFLASLKKLRSGLDDFNHQLAAIDGAGKRLSLLCQETAATCPAAAEALAQGLAGAAGRFAHLCLHPNALPILAENAFKVLQIAIVEKQDSICGGELLRSWRISVVRDYDSVVRLFVSLTRSGFLN
jgi:hypothetical protein